MSKCRPGESIDFEIEKSIEVVFLDDTNYTFNAVIKMEKEKDGVIYLYKNNGNVIEICPPYKYIEIGEVITEDEQ